MSAHHPIEEGTLADLTSSGMWIAVGLVGPAALLVRSCSTAPTGACSTASG